MDQQNLTPEQLREQRRAERLKYMKIQRNIRMGAIALAIILGIVIFMLSRFCIYA